MVKVAIQYKGKGLESIVIKGHADSAEYGHDIVCGAVTIMVTGACNALENDEDYEIEIEEGNASIVCKGAMSDHDQTVLETLILQLKTLEVSPASKGTIEIKERK